MPALSWQLTSTRHLVRLAAVIHHPTLPQESALQALYAPVPAYRQFHAKSHLPVADHLYEESTSRPVPSGHRDELMPAEPVYLDAQEFVHSRTCGGHFVTYSPCISCEQPTKP